MSDSEPADSNEPKQPAEPSSASRRPRLRWYQFSLRSLLIFMLLASVGLSWFGVRYRRARCQRAAVEAAREAGGQITYDHDYNVSGSVIPNAQPPGPAWLRRVLGDDFFMNVCTMTFYENGANPYPLTAKDFAPFAVWEGCEILSFGEPRYCDYTWITLLLNDDAMACVKGWTRLRQLRIYPSSITDAGIAHLAGLIQLQTLVLDSIAITDAGIAYLAGLRQLKRLRIQSPNLTDAGLASLAQLTELQELDLHSHKLTDSGLVHLRALKRLEKLRVASPEIGDAGLVHLAELPQLRVLDLNDRVRRDPNGIREHVAIDNDKPIQLTRPTKALWFESYHGSATITDAGLKHLGRLAQLERLSLDGRKITDAGMVHLAGLAHLQSLSLAETNITDAGLKPLRELTRLERLVVESSEITDAGLTHLQGLEHLQELVLWPEKVTKRGADQLQQALPDCRINDRTSLRFQQNGQQAVSPTPVPQDFWW